MLLVYFSTIGFGQDSLKAYYGTTLPWIAGPGGEYRNIHYNNVTEDSVEVIGEYELVTKSLKCHVCSKTRFDSLVDIELSYCHEKRIGVWTFQNLKNGNIEKGKFSESVHISFYGGRDLDPSPLGRPHAGGYNIEYLRDGKWETFTKDGILFFEAWYREGILLEEKSVGQ